MISLFPQNLCCCSSFSLHDTSHIITSKAVHRIYQNGSAIVAVKEAVSAIYSFSFLTKSGEIFPKTLFIFFKPEGIALSINGLWRNSFLFFKTFTPLETPPNKTLLITATPMADVAIAVQDCTAATPTVAATTEVIITVFTFIKLHLNVEK